MLTLKQQKLMAILPRFFVAISVVSCSYIIYLVVTSAHYRSRVYHRLMLGMACTIVLHSCNKFWGTAAVPEGTPGVYGAKGTVGTCTAHGFLNQMGYTPLIYYVALSFYSFVAVRNNFNIVKFIWMEKWIHIGAIVIPLLSSVYLTTIDAFNFNGYSCWIASVPLGCGEGKDIECTRGPKNIGQVQWLFGALPMMIVLLLPTCVMVALYVYVRRRPKYSILVDANTVAKQAGLYLVALYWTYLFSMIDYAFLFGASREIFALRITAVCSEKLMGFYIMLVYLMLRVAPKEVAGNEVTHIGSTEMSVNRENPAEKKGKGVQASKEKDGEDSIEFFSIFDGTNASSSWKDFVFEGEDEDEDADFLESQKWENVEQT
jgi:hypothetical protein